MSDVFKMDITGIEEVSNNLKAFPRRLKAALALDALKIAKEMEAWAKNPPYPEAPKHELTEKDLIKIKTLAKRGKLKRNSGSNSGGGPYKWRDQTGDARKFLKAHVKWTNTNTLMVSLSHHVEYGIYLELANEGKYAILEEAIRKYAPQFMEGWKKIISEGK